MPEVQPREDHVAGGVPSWNLVLLNRILEYTGKKQHLGGVAAHGAFHARRGQLSAV